MLTMEKGIRSEQYYATARQVFLNTRETRQYESTGNLWGIIHSPATRESQHRDNYEADFESFGKHPITRPLYERYVQGKDSCVIDLAGGGAAAVRDLQQRELVTTGLTVGLTDLRDPYAKMTDAYKSLTYIEGDLFKRDTWNTIDAWLETTPEQKASMILCRPVGGFPRVASLETYLPLLERTWERLSPDNGILLTQLPVRNPQQMQIVTEYFKTLRLVGIDVISSYRHELPVAQFIKHDERPIR